MKSTSQFTLINIFILMIIISFSVNAENATDNISACNQALEKGEYSTAITTANAILKTDPNHRDALICKGRAQGAEGNYSESLKTLELAANNSVVGFEQIISHILIGNLHKKNQQYQDAIASFEKSLSISKSTKDDKFERANYNFIGDIHTLKQDLNAALTSYLAGSKLAMNDNERAESFERIAATYSALKQNDLAIEYQLKATLMQQKSGTLDDYANATYVLGKTYLVAKDYNGAEKTYAKLLQFSKDNGGAYYEAKANYGLAQVKLALNDKDQAKNMLSEALKISKSIGENDLVTEIDASLKGLASN